MYDTRTVWRSNRRFRFGLVGFSVLLLFVGALMPTLSAAAARGSQPTGLLAAIEKSGKLSIAITAFAPEDYQTSSGKWTGYDVDILSGFAHTLHAQLEEVAIPFASSIEAVSTHRYDLTIDIYYSATRAKVIGYSRPLVNYNDAIAVNANSPGVKGTSVADLKGKSVAVVSGAIEVSEAKKIPSANVVQFANVDETFEAVSTNKVNLTIEPDVYISWAEKTNPSLHLKLLGVVPTAIAPPLASLRGYYGVPHGGYSASFLVALNHYLKTIACNGTEAKILAKYNMSTSAYLTGICKAATVYRG